MLTFDEHYYRTGCGRPYVRDAGWLDFFARIADMIARDIAPTRVLDAGCAWGWLVEALRARGVEAFGVDISAYAEAQRAPAAAPWCWRGSLTDEIDGRYDLIVCQEVLAHLTPSDGEQAIANFCRHTDAVLLSAGQYPPHPHHLNLAGPESWTALLLHHGFAPDPRIDVTVMTPWATLYRRV